MRAKPWCAINLMDPDAESQWYETEAQALIDLKGGEGWTITYRPGRKTKAKK